MSLKVITLFLAIISVLMKAKVSNRIKKRNLHKLVFIVQTKRKNKIHNEKKSLLLNTKPAVIQGLYFKLVLIL